MSAGPSNIDREEIAKFEALANRWWDKEGDFKPLHDINPLRAQFIQARVPGGVAGKRVLDVGCGGGILAEALAEMGANVTAIDLASGPLSVARIHSQRTGVDVHYELISTEDLAEREPGAYDIVTCLEMLEHVPHPAAIVTACSRLAKSTGHLFFSTISRNPKAYLFAVIGAEYLLGLLPRGTHDYAKFIRPSELDSFARRGGLALRELTGMHYNPLTARYWLGPGVSVNYLAYYVNAHSDRS